MTDFGRVVLAGLGRWLELTWIEYKDEHPYYVHAGVLPDRPVWEAPNEYKINGAPSFLKGTFSWPIDRLLTYAILRQLRLPSRGLGISTELPIAPAG